VVDATQAVPQSFVSVDAAHEPLHGVAFAMQEPLHM